MPKPDPIRVSDHAVLRYMERSMGLNVDLVRQHIADICSGAAAVGAVCVRSEGLRFEIGKNVVITVRPDGQSPSRTDRDRNQRAIERRSRA